MEQSKNPTSFAPWRAGGRKLPDPRVVVPLAALAVALFVPPTWAQDVLPKPPPPFKGTINFRARDSIPDWPKPVKAPKGAPNVVLILLDDAGFGATGTFGGPVQTPYLDRLAAQGLRYNRFHVTALCAPTRAALLSGRNDHRVGFGIVEEDVAGFPGYNGIWRSDAATIAEVLRLNGYNTAAFGKWHQVATSAVQEMYPNAKGWPNSLGFEYFYGFIGGADSQWEPTLWRNTTLVGPSGTPEQGYYLNTDLANDAIAWVRSQESVNPEKPYFIYFAPGATHAPHQVAKEWIDRYRGQFDEGWDRLRAEIFARQKRLGVIPADAENTPRPKELPAWDSLSVDEKKLCAHQMEIYAGFLAETDYELGRFLDVVQKGPGGQNTIILYIPGDNGAEAMAGVTGLDDRHFRRGLYNPESPTRRLEHLDQLGGPEYYNLYSSGWAWALVAPFQWEKMIASHLGGTRDPLIVSWPAGIKDHGGVRSQYTDVNDVAPTLCELAGIPFPSMVDGVKQLSLDGTSFAYTFDNPNAPSRHRMQIFEQLGNRAIYSDGWLASVRHTVPWLAVTDDFSHDRWQLYHLDTDYSQGHDVADQFPDKLREMQDLFETEAKRNYIYPLIVGHQDKQPTLWDGRTDITFYPQQAPIQSFAAPKFQRWHRITVDAVIPPGGAEGVLLADGSRVAGFVLYVQGQRLVYENNVSDIHNLLRSSSHLPTGEVELAYEFTPGGRDQWGAMGGTGRLFVNGNQVGQARFDVVQEALFGTFSVGRSFVARVSNAYTMPFNFTGTIRKVRLQFH